MQGGAGVCGVHLGYSMIIWLLFLVFFLPALSPCCNADLNSPFPALAVSTIVHSALCWTKEGGSLVKILSILDLFQRGAM